MRRVGGIMNNIKSYVKDYNNFINNVMTAYLNEHNNENIVFSPFSILMLLSIAADMTSGKTHDEIVSVLSHEREYENIRDLLCEIQELISNDSAASSVNALYIKEEIAKRIDEKFINYIDNKYGCKYFESIDKDFISDINKWVKDNTHGMIDSIADDSMKDALLCLMNAVSFESEWQEKYEEDEIFEEPFISIDGVEKEIEMLHSDEPWYIETEDLKGFVKPYKESKYSFMALLPNDDSGKALLEMSRNCNYTELFNNRTDREVYAIMPEFDVDVDTELKPILELFGINKLFSEEADFSPLTTAWIKADSVKHKAHIEVNRKGTKASAVSAIVAVVGCAGIMMKPFVELTRPFMYAVVHNDTGLPIFVGAVNKL